MATNPTDALSQLPPTEGPPMPVGPEMAETVPAQYPSDRTVRDELLKMAPKTWSNPQGKPLSKAKASKLLKQLHSDHEADEAGLSVHQGPNGGVIIAPKGMQVAGEVDWNGLFNARGAKFNREYGGMDPARSADDQIGKMSTARTLGRALGSDERVIPMTPKGVPGGD